VSWKGLLDLAHAMADRSCQDGSPGYSGLVLEDMLQRRDCLLVYQRDRARQLPSPGLGCKIGKVDV